MAWFPQKVTVEANEWMSLNIKAKKIARQQKTRTKVLDLINRKKVNANSS